MMRTVNLMSFFLTSLVLPFLSYGVEFPKDQKCVLIYYDQTPNLPDNNFGEIYSTFTRNLLGHFPELQVYISPIERYKSKEIENCRSSIYIGSYFENEIPKVFLKDFKETKKNVAWLGYNLWLYSEKEQVELFGHSFDGLSKIDFKNPSSDGSPSFFRYMTYKGEQFSKFAKEFKGKFVAPFEMVKLKKGTDLKDVNILSRAIHSKTLEERPYVIEKNNKFFVADVPFSFAHESDRYLIFSDLLFDILDLPPRREKHIAFIRIEDVHPLSNLSDLYTLLDVFDEENIPLHVALVPIFYDPLDEYGRGKDEDFVTIKDHKGFNIWLDRAKVMDAEFIWHGVTHQYLKQKNPHNGYTSADFEFWDAVNNKPVEADSVDFVLNRLELGSSYLDDVGIYPRAWLTPHYQASALDYQIFGKVFPWNVGRVIYFLNEENKEHLPEPDQELRNELYYHTRDSKGKETRASYFKDLEVKTKDKWFGQLYPYEIYNDSYGQRVIPEILGNPQPFESEHVWFPRAIDEIIKDAKRNKVIRDSWASVFFHPYLLTDLKNDGIGEFPGDTRPLLKLIRELKRMGYEFKPLNEFMDETENIRGKEAIFLK